MRLTRQGLKKLTFVTIIAVYLLILVGGIVRSVGAGMGCPDWPKCFGEYIPPTSDANLPEDYQQYFVEKRILKNAKLANILQKIGFSNAAYKLQNDESIKEEEAFNATLAWIEYINRLIGVVIGLLIIGVMLGSFIYWNENKQITGVAILSFLLVVFQGWVGSVVVSTNLLPGLISFHMLLALILISLLIYLYYLIENSQTNMKYPDRKILILSFTMFLLMVPQILLGTEVRGQIDSLLRLSISRDILFEKVDWVFYVHRSFSLVFLFITIKLAIYTYKSRLFSSLQGKLIGIILVAVVIEIMGGAVMAYFSLPAFVQPVHLLMATVLFGCLFYLVLLTKNKLPDTL